MRPRAWIVGAGLVAAFATPSAALADLVVTAGAKASTYAAGPITSKTWSAGLSGGLLKQIVFSEPITPQFSYEALQDVLAAPKNPSCTAGSPLCLGSVNVVLITSQGRTVLPVSIGTGACPAGKVAPAPAHDAAYADTGEWAIDTSAVATVVNNFICFGARVDANPPSVDHPDGEFKLSVDITPAANFAATVGTITYASVELRNLTTAHGPLFTDNPSTPVDVATSITVTPCVAVGDVPCQNAGTSVTDIVTETLGGATGVTVAASANPVKVGTAVTISGVVTRGATGSAGDTVTVLDPYGKPLATTATDVAGAYSVAVILPQSETITASATKPGQATLEKKVALNLACPAPKLSGRVTVTRKGATASVTFKIVAVAGVTYKATVGAKTLKLKRAGRYITFTGVGLKLKKGSKAVVTATKLGAATAKTNVKLR